MKQQKIGNAKALVVISFGELADQVHELGQNSHFVSDHHGNIFAVDKVEDQVQFFAVRSNGTVSTIPSTWEPKRQDLISIIERKELLDNLGRWQSNSRRPKAINQRRQPTHYVVG